MEKQQIKEKIEEIKKEQDYYKKVYNRQRTKQSKRKVYYEKLMPNEEKILELQNILRDKK